MTARRLYGLVTALVLLLSGVAQARDDEVWLTAEVEGNLWRGLHMKAEQFLEFDNSRLINEETLLLLGWKFNSYVSVWAGHRITREDSYTPDGFITEQRPTFDLCLAAPEFGTLKLDFRSRFEWRDKEGSQGYMRYRERLRLRTSWSVTDFKISPYISEEFFFYDKPKQDDADLFGRTRSRIGFTFLPMPSVEAVSCDLYFMVQHDMDDNSSTWDPTNCFGLTVVFKF